MLPSPDNFHSLKVALKVPNLSLLLGITLIVLLSLVTKLIATPYAAVDVFPVDCY